MIKQNESFFKKHWGKLLVGFLILLFVISFGYEYLGGTSYQATDNGGYGAGYETKGYEVESMRAVGAPSMGMESPVYDEGFYPGPSYESGYAEPDERKVRKDINAEIEVPKGEIYNKLDDLQN